MERRNNSVILLILAAFAGMFTFMPRATESTPPPATLTESSNTAASPGASPTSTATPTISPALQMIDQFYYGSNTPPDNPAQLVQKPWVVNSIIAVLPDPVESGLGDQFDNYLDAMQRALADSNYTLDRFRNPWPLHAAGGESPGADKENSSGSDADAIKPPFTREPGMMLFRDAKHQLLTAVFLVGETPTRGIHKTAFKNALTQAVEIANTYPAAPDRPPKCSEATIKVMGPSFSGSADSMKIALTSWLSPAAQNCRPKRIEIVSGSATTIKRGEFLQDLGVVDYHATVIPDEYVLKALRRWLNRRNGDDIAILGEEDTPYGSALVGKPTPTPTLSAQPTSSSAPDASPGDKASESAPTPSSDQALSVSFPLHIAELQRAMQRAEANSKAGALPVPLLQNPNLPLGTAEAQTRVDVFPLFSSSETNSLELLLDGVMRTITDRQIKYVVIVATDIEDTIFLARRIRESCPNVTPIALNGDVLFLHSSVNTYLRGMIVASTYPLYFENQFWTRPETSNASALVQFPSDTAEGVYNATLALLGRSDAMLDYAEPFKPDSKRPPVWITMVGTDQFWPLAIDPVGPSAGDLEAKADAEHHHVDTRIDTHTADYLVESLAVRPATIPANPTFKVYPSPILMLCAIVGIGSLIVWRLCTHTPTEKSRGFDYAIFRLRTMLPVFLQQSFGDAPSADYVHSRRAIATMFLMVLFGLSTTVACFFFLPLRTNPEIRAAVLRFDPLAGIFRPVAFALVVLVLIGVIYFWSDRTAPGTSERGENGHRRWREAAAVAVVVLVVALWMGLAPLDPTERIFFFFRIVDLDGGASPLVPLLLAYGACLVMILGAMRRRTFVEARLLNPQYLGFQTDSFSGVAELETQVRDAVQLDGWKSGQWWMAVGAVSAAYLVYFRPWESSIDRTIFMLAFFAFSLAAYVGIATALFRLLTVWSATRRLLQRMFWHPSRAGYGKLREAMTARDAAIDLFSPAPTVTALEAGLADVRSLLKAASSAHPHGDAAVCELLHKFRKRLARRLAATEARLNRTLHEGALGSWDSEVTERRKTEAHINYVSKLVASIFEPQWRTPSPIPEAKTPPAESDKPPPVDPAGDVFVATRVIDFLRQVMPQLRTLAITSTSAMLLMLFAVSAYPFPTRDHLLWFSWGMVLAAVVSILWMYFSFNRDRVISLICGTTPGQTDWNSTLLTQLLTHGLIPIIVLLGAAYPAELGRLAQWAGGLFGGRG